MPTCTMLSPLPSHPASAACSNKKRNDRYMFSRGWMRGPIRMPDVAQFIVWSEWWHRLLPRPSRSTTSSSDLCASSFSRISLRRLTAQSALCSRISLASFCVYFFPPLLSTAKPPPCGNERQNHASFRRVPPFAPSPCTSKTPLPPTLLYENWNENEGYAPPRANNFPWESEMRPRARGIFFTMSMPALASPSTFGGGAMNDRCVCPASLATSQAVEPYPSCRTQEKEK